MSRTSTLAGNYLLGSFENPGVRRVVRNRHTEEYDDDGVVIAISLNKFFTGLAEYSKFLDSGSRAYISLTDKVGDEMFQFTMIEQFNGNAFEIPLQISVSEDTTPRTNVSKICNMISKDSLEPILMLEEETGYAYGVLYPMVTLEKK